MHFTETILIVSYVIDIYNILYFNAYKSEVGHCLNGRWGK